MNGESKLSITETVRKVVNCQFNKVRASLNSYLDVMRHYNSYNIRRKALMNKSHEFFKYGYLNHHLWKYVLKKVSTKLS
ncbi:hypothetical protein FACS189430_07950 [Bacteroidia bacterium]|nr:hypothetical protein FACS189430_07950 [Bacteroidia bacterium]